jgi:hypothetical protein
MDCITIARLRIWRSSVRRVISALGRLYLS